MNNSRRAAKHPSRQHRVATLLLLTLALLGVVLRLGAQVPASSPRLNANARAQIEAIRRDREAQTPAQRKIVSSLLYAARERVATRKAVAAAPKLRSRVTLEADGRVRVRIKGAVTPALLGAIIAAGGTGIDAHLAYGTAYATLPPENLEVLASRDDVEFISLPPTVEYNRENKKKTSFLEGAFHPHANTPVNDPEGDVTHGADIARAQYGATGRGIKVGVLSDSLDNAQGAYQNALLNGYVSPVTPVPGQAGDSASGSAEGLAMLEAVHRLAPDAQLFFATAGGTPEQMAKNIASLADLGCTVIIDDLFFSNENPFQDDVIAQAVNAVSARSILYFSCAANYGNQDSGTSSCWEGDFKGSPQDQTVLDFQPGGSQGPQEYNYVGNQSGNDMRVILFWSEPIGSATSSYSLYEVDWNGFILQAAENNGKDPSQTLNNVSSGNYVAVVKNSGGDRFLHLDIASKGSGFQFSTAGRVRGHNACGAPNAFCVAAVPAADGQDSNSPSGPYPSMFGSGQKVETFSADGPRRVFFNPDGTAITPGNFSSTGGRLLAKPDFTAADGVTTSLGSDSGLNPFFGTSCAAPHAGAIAVMLLSYRPNLTPAQAGAALRAGTVQVANPGAGNRNSGAGILLVPSVIQVVNIPPSITTFAPANGPAGTLVTVTGLNLKTIVGASFNGVPTAFSPVSDTAVTVTVPAGATAGPITILTAGGTAVSAVPFTLTASVSTPVVNSAAAARGQVGSAFSYQVTATNAPATFGASGLPTGLAVNPATGLISGVPSVPGAFPVTVSAGNAAGGSSSAVVTLTILPAPPAITSPSTVSGQVSVAFSFQIGGSNAPTGYGATGLPAGLTLDPATGLVTGIPVEAGTYSVTVSATNAGGSSSAILTITVAPNIPTVTVAASPSTASISGGTAAQFVVALSAVQDRNVLVTYSVKGTAANGTDYTLLNGKVKIKAGKTSKAIKVKPLGDLGGATKKTVVLKLQPGDGYVVGTTGKVKVKITN